MEDVSVPIALIPNVLLFERIQQVDLDIKPLVAEWSATFKQCVVSGIYDLIDLFLKFSGFMGRLPLSLIVVENVSDTLSFILSDYVQNTYDMENSKIEDEEFCKRIGLFFETLIQTEYEFLFLCKTFKRYFIPLALNLSDSGHSNLRYIGTVFGLKTLTGLLKTDIPIDQLDPIIILITDLYRRRWNDKLATTRLFCVQELNVWIGLNFDRFMTDNYLKYLIWLSHDQTHNVKLACLQVMELLISTVTLHPRLKLFAERVSVTIPKLVYSDNVNVVITISNIYLLLYKYFPNFLSKSKVHHIYEVMFSYRRDCAIAASKLFIALWIDKYNNNVEKIKNILKFVTNIRITNSEEYFVDTIIHNCSVVTNWNDIIDLLIDETILSPKERSKLLTIALFSAKYVTTGDYAENRTPKVVYYESKKIALNNAVKKLTDAILPSLQKLLDCDQFENNALAYSQMLKLIQFCKLNTFKLTDVKLILRKIVHSYTHYNDFILIRVCFETLHIMCNKVKPSGRLHCYETQDKLVHDSLSIFKIHVQHFNQSITYYSTDESKRSFLQCFLKIICISKIPKFSAYCAAEFPVEYLKKQLPEDSFWLHVRVYSSILNTITFRNDMEALQNIDDITNNPVYTENLDRIKDFIKIMADLMIRYFNTINGYAYFYCLYLLAVALQNLKMDETTKCFIYSHDTRNKLLDFVISYVPREPTATKVSRYVCASFFLHLIANEFVPFEFLKYFLRNLVGDIDSLKGTVAKYIVTFFKEHPEQTKTAMLDALIDMHSNIYHQENVAESIVLLKNCCRLVFEIGLLILPDKELIRSAVLEFHIKAIDYACSDAEHTLYPHLSFLIIAAHFSYVLVPSKKLEVIRHMERSFIHTNHMCLTTYFNSVTAKDVKKLSWPMNYNDWWAVPYTGHVPNHLASVGNGNGSVSAESDIQIRSEQRHNDPTEGDRIANEQLLRILST